MSTTLRQLAELVGGRLHGPNDLVIQRARPVRDAQPGDISFIESEKYAGLVHACQASALVVSETLPTNGQSVIRVADPLTAFIAIVRHLSGQSELPVHGVDPKADVHPTVTLGPEINVHAFASIGEGSVLGAPILALDAGKHVYVEKPCCHNIREGRLMADAVKRSGKLLQVGTQSRSTAVVREAIDRLADHGEIGDVLVAKAWNSQLRRSIGKAKPTEPTAHLDYDSWVGPAPMVPYRPNLLPGIWRWWYDFGCGDIGNDGVHDIDVACWGLGVETHPSRITCLGGKYFIAARVGRVLHFDPKTEQIQNDSEANALVRRKYRDDHWAVPKNV